MTPILIRTSSPDDWKRFLADEKHWKTGYSARALAYSWEAADGLPAELSVALASNADLAKAELLLAIPEHKVPLPGSGRPSQTDLWLLLRSADALISVAVEGKLSRSPLGQQLARVDRRRSRNSNRLQQVSSASRAVLRILSVVEFRSIFATSWSTERRARSSKLGDSWLRTR